ncbi:MAG: hypothetical protein O7G87_17300 [bacterium]|nr:hypothetical protein [bacterium]
MKHACYIIALCLLAIGCAEELPTGINRSDIEGVWSGDFGEVTLMGRTLTGPVDWKFSRKAFEILFIDPGVDGAERMTGDWKFDNSKMVVTLRSSFPAGNDVGAVDTLAISILDTRMSIRTLGGSSILLRKTRLALKPTPVPFRNHPLALAYLNRRKPT